MRIRTTKTSSGATAVQVVNYLNNRMEVLAHIGSAFSDSDLRSLKRMASNWIHSKNNSQLSFLPQLESEQPSSSLAQLSNCECLGFRYRILHECLFGVAI